MARDIEKAARVTKIARMTGLTKRQVDRVILGISKNDLVMTLYMMLLEGENELIEDLSQYSRQIRKHAA